MSTPGQPQPGQPQPQPGQQQGWQPPQQPGWQQPNGPQAWQPHPQQPNPQQQPQQGWQQQNPQQPWGQPGHQQAGAQQGWGQPAPWGQPPAKPGSGRLIGLIAGVVALVAVAVLAFVFIGRGPSSGECVSVDSDNAIETVDCDSSEAAYRLLGTDDERDDLSYPEFLSDDSTCSQYRGVVRQIWYGDTGSTSSSGTIYCLGSL